MTLDDIATLEAELQRERRDGVRLYAEWAVQKPVEQAQACADDLAARLGLIPIGDAWRRIDAAEAREIITDFLHHDLAYNLPLMSQERASVFAERILTLAGHGAFLLTNVSGPRAPMRGWTSVTTATFDHAVVFLGNDLAGMIWVEDED